MDPVSPTPVHDNQTWVSSTELPSSDVSTLSVSPTPAEANLSTSVGADEPQTTPLANATVHPAQISTANAIPAVTSSSNVSSEPVTASPVDSETAHVDVIPINETTSSPVEADSGTQMIFNTTTSSTEVSPGEDERPVTFSATSSIGATPTEGSVAINVSHVALLPGAGIKPVSAETPTSEGQAPITTASGVPTSAAGVTTKYEPVSKSSSQVNSSATGMESTAASTPVPVSTVSSQGQEHLLQTSGTLQAAVSTAAVDTHTVPVSSDLRVDATSQSTTSSTLSSSSIPVTTTHNTVPASQDWSAESPAISTMGPNTSGSWVHAISPSIPSQTKSVVTTEMSIPEITTAASTTTTPSELSEVLTTSQLSAVPATQHSMGVPSTAPQSSGPLQTAAPYIPDGVVSPSESEFVTTLMPPTSSVSDFETVPLDGTAGRESSTVPLLSTTVDSTASSLPVSQTVQPLVDVSDHRPSAGIPMDLHTASTTKGMLDNTPTFSSESESVTATPTMLDRNDSGINESTTPVSATELDGTLLPTAGTPTMLDRNDSGINESTTPVSATELDGTLLPTAGNFTSEVPPYTTAQVVVTYLYCGLAILITIASLTVYYFTKRAKEAKRPSQALLLQSMNGEDMEDGDVDEGEVYSRRPLSSYASWRPSQRSPTATNRSSYSPLRGAEAWNVQSTVPSNCH